MWMLHDDSPGQRWERRSSDAHNFLLLIGLHVQAEIFLPAGQKAR
jgi:hypothetical protein